MDQEQAPENHIRVIGICGSLKEGSYTRMALEGALQGAEELGAQTRLIDLRDYDLVFCDGNTDASAYPAGVSELRHQVSRAHGIILGTPVYHGGFSGVLKNALDLMGFTEFESKMVGLIGVSGGRMGATDALNGLRAIGRALHAWVIPQQVMIPEAWKAFDQEGNLKHNALQDKLMDLGRQVARFSYLHTSEKALDFVRAWESAPVNPGGGNK